ncbi:MAG: HesA/MoeB/ThiF family protein [Flavobacteriaceae bacterium]|jgi:sulfur-carrier protein adenylyltransferase/sulfurtransferase|nr:HesA/MoeB/ThiF family protein [Flavobacteriaceae bacterium]
MDRYNRHIILSEIGQIGQNKLLSAKVLVVGAGGLGCPVLQYLAAAGVGTIGIIDFDVVEKSNLQRQVLFGTSSLGKNKAEEAKSRLQDLNDTITIKAYLEMLTFQNAIDLFNQYDIIVDGTDNFETRYLINDGCVITGKPLVFGAIYKFQGQVSVFNYENGPTYRCAFPNKPKKDTVPNCSEIGVLGVLPGIIGTMQANEVLKIILGIGSILSGKLLCYDALSYQTSILNIKKSENEIQKVLKNKSDFKNQKSEVHCDSQSVEISIKEVWNNKNIQFIDVREAHEQPKIKGLNVIHLPLSAFLENLDLVEKDKKKVVFCQSGIRSKMAVFLFKKHNIHNCYSIKEGALEINKYLKKSNKQVSNE